MSRVPRWLLLTLLAPRVRRPLLLAADGAIGAVSLWLAMLLRFEGAVPSPYAEALPAMLALAVLCRGGASWLLRVHRWSFRLWGLSDAARLAVAGVLGTGLLMTLLVFFQLPAPGRIGPPRSVVVLDLLLVVALTGALRFSPRLATHYAGDLRARRRDRLRALIVGAGAAGELLLRDLQRSSDHDYRVIGFLDDDPQKKGAIVGGRPVLGAVDELPAWAERLRVEKVLIAIPHLSAERIREILSLCGDLKLRFKILPVSFSYLRDRTVGTLLQDLRPEHLLPRDTVSFAEMREAEAIRGRRALVTGGAGSIGSEIVRQLLAAGARQVVIADVDENGMYLLARRLQQLYPDAEVAAELCDVRDAARLAAVFDAHRPEDVFHAAAHKHVPLLEAAPCQAVKNNVLGTRLVAEAAIAAGAERFVMISTDKAVRPSSVMGATKRVAEMISRTFAGRSRTRFCAVRFGNVLDSAGSVVPLFREQIAAGGPVTVTHPEVRRYFMTIPEAVGLVLKAGYGDYGELCILEMGEQIRILDLARHMITMSGLAPDLEVPIVFTGLRPGEKLAEELMTEDEERAHWVAEKICVTEGPPPPRDLLARVDALVAAARAEDAGRTVALLADLVPKYQPTAGEAETVRLRAVV
ncbi:MAG TPA: nucleoside-diphosphate sugar epimerase/dehydratase [Thermoanaerobaculia bacterium]|nr:nucleoside-diphosphate sugar epimerase/dehydratase [Thermoanaerobaculia bacterium]